MPKIQYGRLPTEQNNFRSRRIDRLPLEKTLDLLNREDQTVPRAVAKVKKQIARGVKLILQSLKSGGRLFFAGAGTSGRLGVLEAAECPPTFSTPSSLVQAVIAGGRPAVFRSQEGAEDRRDEALKIFRKKLRSADILIAIAASGVTPFVDGAVRAAREKGCRTILVACNAASPLRGKEDCLIAPRVGPEVISGSTRLKGGTATKLVLNMLTVTSMVRLGKVYQNWMVDLQPKSKKLNFRALRLVEHLGGVSPQKARLCLKKARQKVKVAILMAQKNLSYHEASRRLKTSENSLHRALMSKPSSGLR